MPTELMPTDTPALPKRRNIYIALALFLGLLGIHNIYAGRYKTAIAQALITVSLFWTGLAIFAVYIWVLFDVFMVRYDGNRNLMFEKSSTPRIIAGILMIFPGIYVISLMAIILSISFSSWLPGSQSQIKKGALSFGRLADYPASTRNFQTATAGSPFTREFIVCFEASAQDIKDWLARSEGLKAVEPQIFTENHQYLPSSDNFNNRNIQHEYHMKFESKPEWLNNLKIKNGRKYQIPGEKGHGVGGVLIVNEDTNTVYIDVSWS